MGANPLRARLREGATAVGAWCVTPSAFTAEVLATSGFDYVCIDLQHGLTSLDTVWQLLVAVGRKPFTEGIGLENLKIELDRLKRLEDES